MRAYNLHFQTSDAGAGQPEDAVEIGWLGTDGPAIPTEQWPRGTLTGLPMMHGFTIRLPEEYLRKGAEYPGIAFFQGEGEFAEEFEREAEDPFVQQLAGAQDHPMLQRREDIIGGEFAFIWLTEAELSGGPTPPPEDVRRDGEHNDDEGPNAWDSEVAHGLVYQSDRDDLNAGKAPSEPAVNGYQDPYDFEGPTQPFKPWADPLHEFDGHLGGTSFPYQALPEDLTPYYLEFWEFGMLNFGGGVCQLDLESETFDWACG
ncbi:MAG: hypothetical protein ACTHXA_10965 [Gulosibacter sp.]|uniref:hypothetical protein n=1 Tax=Gulosibacter sp. TaxID=2817531 RepID=UPI003F93DB35